MARGSAEGALPSAGLIAGTSPLTDGEKPIGELEVLLTPRFGFAEILRPLLAETASFIFFLFILMAALYLVLAKSVIRPLQRMEDYALRSAKRKFRKSVHAVRPAAAGNADAQGGRREDRRKKQRPLS